MLTVYVDWHRVPKGYTQLLLELYKLREYRKDIPCSWFRRACKRSGVSRTSAKKWLQVHGAIGNNWKHPIPNRLKPMQWETYSGWKYLGRQVAKGESSYARNEQGEAVFNTLQLMPYL